MAALSSDLDVLAFFRFAIRFDPKKDEPIAWLKDRAVRKALGEAIFSAPLFRDGLKFGNANDDELGPITAKTGQALFDGKGEVIVELQGRDGRDRDRHVQVQALEGEIEIRIELTTIGLAGFEQTALDDIIAVLQQVSKALHGVAGLQMGHVRAGFGARELEYPRARPPRVSKHYPERSIITFIDPAFHKTEHPYARPGESEKLTAPPPPSPAKMSKDGDLVVVRWARSLADDDLVAAAAGHNAWITSRIDTKIEEHFNELGDQRELVDGRPKPPLTIYAADWEWGYKAVLVLPDGSVEDDAWNEAAKIAKAKKLADGSPVASMRIVVPLREHVFMVADRAKKAGFDAVLYPDDKGAFWNPDPPGNWLTPPVKTPKSPKGKGG
jgi:hypothetical protein